MFASDGIGDSMLPTDFALDLEPLRARGRQKLTSTTFEPAAAKKEIVCLKVDGNCVPFEDGLRSSGQETSPH